MAEIQEDQLRDVRGAMVQMAINSLAFMSRLLDDEDADDALKLKAAEFVVGRTTEIARAEELGCVCSA